MQSIGKHVIFVTVTVQTSYWVLDTDYTSFALVYTCEDLGNDQRAGKKTLINVNYYK